MGNLIYDLLILEDYVPHSVIDIKFIPLLVPRIFHNLYSLATPSTWHIEANLYEMDDDWVKPVLQSVEQEWNSDRDPRVSK